MTNGWDDVNESTNKQDLISFYLRGAYALVSAIALVQLVRIQRRVPEHGWTTQKVFHLMNFIALGARAVLFGYHQLVHPKVLCWILLDLPGLFFLSAYTILILFWAEIYHQAKGLPGDKLRKTYIGVNVAVYLAQVCVFVCVNAYLVIKVSGNLSVNGFIGVVFSHVYFLVCYRLFVMLKRFPIESRGRSKKMYEVVVTVTAIGITSFLIRCIVVGVSAFDGDLTLDVLDRPVQNLIYYMVVEVIPSALVLFILRKLPPKRVATQYHPVQ
ncbi:unnamed protein product [Eruca vesicaria subsp. sativa]|uniref:THH1/TOM1/TOM3 domain-containing protein n=1 Tax=Eruca vesicaria subsp. sativa TaxID=29727 RepID=A0ABC8K443_ERUVS|nr:unnamed protein product [Eruca vesicaria subsp. sativa]